MQEFLDYFENTWLKGDFKPESWNFYADSGSMTNNPSEGKSMKHLENLAHMK